MFGERLRTARESLGMTQGDLSAATGISQAKVSKMETGLAGPADDDIDTLSSVLGFPRSFFSDAPLYPVAAGLYRRQSRTSARDLKRMTAQTAIVAGAVEAADGFLGIRRVLIEPYQGDIDDRTIARIAGETRALAGLPERGPVPNAVRSCERLGVPVAVLPSFEEGSGICGFSVWGDVGERRPLIVLSDGLSGDRLRATVAHELGHLILHTVNQRGDRKVVEEQGWRFAHHYLFPEEDAREAFGPEPPTLRSMLRLKGVYGVSVAFMVKALTAYGIVDEVRARSLWKQLSARGWRKEEPGEVGIERPSLVPQVLRAQKECGVEVGVQEFLLAKLSSEDRKRGAGTASRLISMA